MTRHAKDLFANPARRLGREPRGSREVAVVGPPEDAGPQEPYAPSPRLQAVINAVHGRVTVVERPDGTVAGRLPPLPENAEVTLGEARIWRDEASAATARAAPQVLVEMWLHELAAGMRSREGEVLDAQITYLTSKLGYPPCCFTVESETAVRTRCGPWFPKLVDIEPVLREFLSLAQQEVRWRTAVVAALEPRPLALGAPTGPAVITAGMVEAWLGTIERQPPDLLRRSQVRGYRARLRKANPDLAVQFSARLSAMADVEDPVPVTGASPVHGVPAPPSPLLDAWRAQNPLVQRARAIAGARQPTDDELRALQAEAAGRVDLGQPRAVASHAG